MARGVPNPHKEDLVNLYIKLFKNDKVNSLRQFARNQKEHIANSDLKINLEEFETVHYQTLNSWLSPEQKEKYLAEPVNEKAKREKAKKQNQKMNKNLNQANKELLNDLVIEHKELLQGKQEIDNYINDLRQKAENEELKEGDIVELKKRIDELDRKKSTNNQSKSNPPKKSNQSSKSILNNKLILGLGGLGAGLIIITVIRKVLQKRKQKEVAANDSRTAGTGTGAGGNGGLEPGDWVPGQ